MAIEWPTPRDDSSDGQTLWPSRSRREVEKRKNIEKGREMEQSKQLQVSGLE